MTVRLMTAGLLVGMMGLMGCRQIMSEPMTGYVPAEEIGVMTVGLDDHDYDMVVEGVASEMMEQGLPKGYVVALGPVDTRRCRYDVQVETLQKSLMVVFNKERTLKFTAAINAMRGGTAQQELYKIIEYNWFNNNPIDSDDLQRFGKLSSVNGILFGRVSALERRIPGTRLREITYRFVWELADTQTGELKLSHEEKIRKNVR